MIIINNVHRFTAVVLNINVVHKRQQARRRKDKHATYKSEGVRDAGERIIIKYFVNTIRR